MAEINKKTLGRRGKDLLKATAAVVGALAVGTILSLPLYFTKQEEPNHVGRLTVQDEESIWKYATAEGCLNNAQKAEYVKQTRDYNVDAIGPDGIIYEGQKIFYLDRDKNGKGGMNGKQRDLNDISKI